MARRKTTLTAQEAIDYSNLRIGYNGVDSHRRLWERQWLRWVAFLNGKQHLIDEGVRFRNPVLPPHRVLYQANFIKEHVTRAVASAMATNTTFRSPPADSSRRSRYSSFVAEKLFDHMRDQVRWNAKLELMLVWAAALGSSFARVLWDPNKGEPERFYLKDRRERKPVFGLSQEEMLDKEIRGEYVDLPKGDVRLDVFNFFQVHWDWRMREEGLEGGYWVGTKEMVDISALEDRFGYERTKDIAPLEWDSEATYFEELIAFLSSGFNSPTTTYAVPREKKSNQTLVVELWEIPTRQNGGVGRHIIVAGKSVVLENSDNPYRALPFAKLDWDIRPGSFVGHSLVERLISPQFQYNKARGTIVEHQNIYGHPAQFVPKGSQIPTGFMAIQPGLVYEYNYIPGQKPVETGPTPTLSKEVAQNAALAQGEMDHLSSQPNVDTSKLPGQIRGSQGIELLLEERNKTLQPTARRAVELTVEIGNMMLRLAQRHYDGRRKLVYVGEGNDFRVIEFDRSQIGTEIKVVGEPAYFQSFAARRSQAMEVAQAGILDPINNPEDKVALLKALAFGTPDEIIKDRLADEANAEELLMEMLEQPFHFVTGSPDGPVITAQPQPWDNVAAHKRVFERLLKSRAEWRQVEQLAQQVIATYYGRLLEKEQEALQQQIAMAESIKGTPGARGVASQPRARAG